MSRFMKTSIAASALLIAGLFAYDYAIAVKYPNMIASRLERDSNGKIVPVVTYADKPYALISHPERWFESSPAQLIREILMPKPQLHMGPLPKPKKEPAAAV